MIFVPSSPARAATARGWPAAVRASVRIQSTTPSALTTPTSSRPSSGRRVLEHLDAAEEPTDVADEDAACVAVVPGDAVDLDLRLERLRAQVLRAGPDVGGAAEPVLERAVGLLDHRRVESGAGHDGEVLAVELSHVELAPLAAQPDRDRALDVLRDAEVRREQVRRAGRQDRERRLRSRRPSSTQRCTVPSPPQRRAARRLRSSARFTCFDTKRLFGTSIQSGSSTPWRCELAPELGQPVAERSCPRARSTATFVIFARPRAAATCAARLTRTSAHRAATPTSTPPATSSGWCMPRYIRANATNTAISAAAAQTAIRAARFSMRDA